METAWTVLLTSKTFLCDRRVLKKDILMPMRPLYFTTCKLRRHLLAWRQVHGNKMEKARLTILVSTGAEEEKLPLLWIGKAEQPRWPVVMGKRVYPPVSYGSSRKSLMVEKVWTRWLTSLDKRMRAQEREILLFMGNCSTINLMEHSVIFPRVFTSKHNEQSSTLWPKCNSKQES